LLEALNKSEDIKSCKELVLNNESVKNYFGVIKTIRPKINGWGKKWSSEEGVSGSCGFSIQGGIKKGNISVRWIKENDKIKITMISTRVGLCSSYNLWPEPTVTPPNYILSSNAWDGIELLIGTLIISVLYFNIKKVGMFVTLFYPRVTWTEKSQTIAKWVLLAVTFGYLSYSVLCFLNICTLF
jgi:hypothetical protein